MFRGSEINFKNIFNPRLFSAKFWEIPVAKDYGKISRDLIGSYKKHAVEKKKIKWRARSEAKLVIFKDPEVF